MKLKLRNNIISIFLVIFLSGCGLFSDFKEVSTLNKGFELGSQGEFEKAKILFGKITSEKSLDYFFKKVYIKIADDALTKKIDKRTAEYLFLGIKYYSDIWGREPDKAISEIEKSLSFNPDYEEAHLYLGLTYTNKGLDDRAITEFKKVIEKNPNHIIAHFNLAAAYLITEKVDEAISEYENTLAIYPDIPAAHYNLAICYTIKEKYDLAVKHLDIALKDKKYLKSIGVEIDQKLINKLKPYRK